MNRPVLFTLLLALSLCLMSPQLGAQSQGAPAPQIADKVDLSELSLTNLADAKPVSWQALKPETLARPDTSAGPGPGTGTSRPVPRAGHWVLIVADTHLGSTPELMLRLRSEAAKADFDGERVIVLLTGARELALPWQAQDLFPADAKVATTGLRALAPKLELRGSPMIYALNAQDQIQWRHVGLPDQRVNLAAQIKNWLGPKAIKPPPKFRMTGEGE
jgi:hypothetical protein